jgi:putative nucleotidyltransferase with HDIG domain
VLTFSLAEESAAVDWLHGELREGQGLHLVEAETVVQSLALAMRGDQEHLIPLLRLKSFDQYTTTHAMNVSVLAMALAEYLELRDSEIRAFGVAGLLHDLGKVTIPEDILNKSGRLTESEREVMNRHPAEGARIILETEENLDLAAVVAYEHHIKLNGEGYPKLRHPRRCHQASDLIHVCDVFDALRTHRPYREAWETERVLQYIERGAGREFDPDLALPFVRMMRAWHTRLAEVEDRGEPVLVAGHEGVADVELDELDELDELGDFDDR